MPTVLEFIFFGIVIALSYYGLYRFDKWKKKHWNDKDFY